MSRVPYDGPPPPDDSKKSPQEQLDDLENSIATLEEKKKELLFEVAKEEVLQDENLHDECISFDALERAEKEADEAQKAREEAEQEADEAWQLLPEFGSHTAACLSGALVGSQKLQPLCTCGWNEVATRLERG